MKPRHAIAALILLAFAGCAEDPEDRAFFEQGWQHPDRGANQRMYGDHTPMSPDEQAKLEDR